MSAIKDASLYPSGLKKIDWVRANMPAITLIERRFKKERPLEGIKIALSVHLEAKTANLAIVLREGGAEVRAAGCNPLSTQDDVAAALDHLGFEVFSWRGESEADYEKNLLSTLEFCPDIIIDDGGDLSELLHGQYGQYAQNLIGGCEETTTGVLRLRARTNEGRLNFPMVAVNDAICKNHFDNRYGTGQSVWDAIMHTTNLMVTGKYVVVAGYGYCGRGIAMRAKGLGAVVVVTEIDPHKALEAYMDGYLVMPMEKAALLGDIFVTSTGCEKVIRREHMEQMKNGAILSNAGHFDVEIDKDALKALAEKIETRRDDIEGYYLRDGRVLNLLAEGRLVNLAAGNGHPAEIMDMSFSIQALCVEYIAKYGKELEPGVYDVPPEIDREVAFMKLAAQGLEIDYLSEEQKSYLGI